MTNSLEYLHLRFDVSALEPIQLNQHRAGDYLRNALAAVMLRAVCPETQRGEKPTPEHAAVCPACWLLAAEVAPGEVRRAYALAPPLPQRGLVQASETFSFIFTLYGRGIEYLPYFVLAAPEMGRMGVGPGRGRFALDSIWAVEPLSGLVQAVLKPGEQVARLPARVDPWSVALHLAQAGLPALASGDLKVRFLTPMRLVDGGELARMPDFGVFFRRLLERIDELARQMAGQERRPAEDVQRLYALADRVRLADADVEWVDLKSWSGRTRKHTPMGGFVGLACYRAADWTELLPWLIFGQGVQAGKLAVKGNGVFELVLPGRPGYWQQPTA
ncbi:MAG: CRISPR system precrRNA processing endoribonuclease RAMP protein Cas6 [Anaerolineales bacterium]|nr:CRISPR system precrRNA processing endoribonuclease RAMP protein Cas6 [Anaerolineales bacterium]